MGFSKQFSPTFHVGHTPFVYSWYLLVIPTLGIDHSYKSGNIYLQES